MPNATSLGEPGLRRMLGLAVGCYAMAVVAGFLYVLNVGQDFNFDARNYHYYNAFAWLAQRTFEDVAPAQVQSYLNPLQNLPYYFIAAHLPPRFGSFLLVGMWALPIVPLVFITTACVKVPNDRQRAIVCAASVAIAASSSAYLCQAGTSFTDPWLSAFPLAGLALLVCPNLAVEPRRACIVGALTGAVIALKWTYIAFAPALAVFIVYASERRLASVSRNLGCAFVGGLVAAVLLGGFWHLRLWQEFGNPWFPFLNGVFRSPYYVARNFIDDRYRITSLVDFLSFPLDLARGAAHSTELAGLRDPRWLIAIGLCVLACRPLRANRTLRALGFYWVVAFLSWGLLFGIQRYAVILDVLLGPIIVTAIVAAISSWWARATAYLGVSTVCAMTSLVPSYGRVTFDDSWFSVEIPRELTLRPMDLLMLSPAEYPYSFVVPYFHPDSRFFRLGGSFSLKRGSPFKRRLRALVADPRRPVMAIGFEETAKTDRALAEIFRFKLIDDRCTSFKAKLHNYYACEVEGLPRGQRVP